MIKKRVLRLPKFLMISLLVFILVSMPLISTVQAAGQNYQIGIFLAPTWSYTNTTEYDWIRDANINFVQLIPGTSIDTEAKVNTVLGLCNTRGIKAQVADSRSESLMTTATDADIDAIANSYKNNGATAGYYVKDEPTTDAITQRAAYVYKRFLMNDPDSQPNMNLFIYAAPDFLTVNKRWVQLVDPSNLKYLTFDEYPYLTNGVPISLEYYKNLMINRSVGLSYNIKTGCYMQSTGDSTMRRPTENEMRLNAWTSVAYGIKALYYFTWMQTLGIINDSGQKTDTYVPVQTINGQIKALGPILMGLTSRDVYFTGTHYVGTTPTPSDYFFNPTTNYDQIISHFANASGRSYVMVVNRDFTNTRTLTFNLPSKPATLNEIRKDNATEQTVASYSSSTGNFSDSFLPGEGRLYALPANYALSAKTVDDKDIGMIYSGGGWTYSANRGVGDYTDDLHATTVNGDYFQYTFNGTGVDYVTEKGPGLGDVDIYIDGVFQQTVNCDGSIPNQPLQTIYSKTGLTNGTHTIKGVKKSGTYMTFDIFKVSQGSVFRNPIRTNDSDTGITYSGSGWTYGDGRGVGDAFNDVHSTAKNDDYFQYTFTGTGVDYVTETSPGLGNVDIYIDGTFQQTVSCVGTVANLSQQTVYSKTGLTYGTHTIKGVKQSGAYMIVDALNENTDSNLISNSGFENGITSWSVYDGTGSSIMLDTVNKHSGINSVRSYNRTRLWSSPVQDVTSELKASGIGNYNLSAWIKGTANDRSQVCVALTDSIGTHWVATDFKTINSTSWIQNAKYCNITWTGELISAKVYVQTEMYGWDIYVDDFVLTR